jgi:hypothetical protein
MAAAQGGDSATDALRNLLGMAGRQSPHRSPLVLAVASRRRLDRSSSLRRGPDQERVRNQPLGKSC